VSIGSQLIYSRTARRFHWWSAGFIGVQIALGIAMDVRGNWLDLWDGTTEALYSTHKLIGATLLVLLSARLLYRLVHGRPGDAPGLERWQAVAGNTNHVLMYGLLIVVPVLGWVGVQLYPALGVFGLFSLPTFLAPNEKLATVVFAWHGAIAYGLLVLVAIHIAAALYHRLVRQDGVLARMLPDARKTMGK
jgi:cytochrome b561